MKINLEQIYIICIDKEILLFSFFLFILFLKKIYSKIIYKIGVCSMIKKINVLIIILIVIILGISLSNNDVNSVSVNKKDYKALIDNNSFIDIYYEIDKTGEDNNFLSGVKFNLRDINNSYIASFTEVDDYYELNEYKNLCFTKAYNFLSDEQKKSVEKIKTTKDLNYYYKKGILKCNFSDGIDKFNFYKKNKTYVLFFIFFSSFCFFSNFLRLFQNFFVSSFFDFWFTC